jgi:RND superfamily putative drug exporter
MFTFLGQVVRRGWLFWLAAWAALLTVTWWLAPPWEQVAQDREFAFLPADAPSRQADEVYAQAFPTDRLASNIVLVLRRTDGTTHPLATDLGFIGNVLEPGIRQIAEAQGGLAFEPKASEEPLFDEEKPEEPPAARSIIARILTPNTPGLGGQLVSPDEQVLLVVVGLTTEFLSHDNCEVIDRIDGLLADLRRHGKIPDGLDIAMTGSAVIGRDHSVAQLDSVRATGLLTVVLVVMLLFLIYRAPLLALIPLLTVYLTVQVAMHVLALLAQGGHLTPFQGLQIYISILAYGAGVDYSLFLTARYREELQRGLTPGEAVAGAIGGVGAALTASAATVICGIGMMYFAQFGKFREAGVAIPLSLFLVLCATLTFSPSLLRLAGRWAFWPHALGGEPPEVRGPIGRLLQLADIRRFWDWVGRILLRRAGTVWLAAVALMAPFAVFAGLNYNHVSYDIIGDLPPSASSVPGTKVLQAHFPAGLAGPTTLVFVNPNIDFTTDQGRELVRGVTDRLRDQRDALGVADVRSLTAPLGVTPAADRNYSGINAPDEVRQQELRFQAREHFVGDFDGRLNCVTRFELILSRSPFARESMEGLDRIEQAVRDALPVGVASHTRLYAAGATASVRDLATVMRQDRTRIDTLVLAVVFVILLVLLRRLVVTAYLLLSVLFSYFATLGVTLLLFWLLDPHGFAGLDWKVPMFLFTILIAVGEDYNILLMARVREEERVHGPVHGVVEALDRTGPIISSCGIIMAGTFATLLAGSLTEMKQLGFALAFGVLLDTFVVRPVLVPAFLLLWERGQSRLRPTAGVRASGRQRQQQTPEVRG